MTDDETDEDRTTAIGLFHFAHSYAASASALCNVKLHATHPGSPIRYLYSHAIELYLKSFLRMNGISVDELRSRDLGHNVAKCAERAMSFGLSFSQVQLNQIECVNDAILDRYIVTGSRFVLESDTLHELCVHLHNQIGPAVYEKSGINRQVIQLSQRD